MYSTVNVQHLESLNDQVAELTGTRVRETVPDAVIGAADDVVLIDITPESLIERLLAGKVYPGERIQAALNNFFKVENLSALREVALRQVAEEVEHKRIPADADGRPGDERLIDTAAPPAIGERLLALITPRRSPNASCGAPGARRSDSAPSSTSCGSPTTSPPGGAGAARRAAPAGQRPRRAPADRARRRRRAVTQRVARERGTTYVLIGAPTTQRAAPADPAGPALPVLALLPGVDLRIVADRTQRRRRHDRRFDRGDRDPRRGAGRARWSARPGRLRRRARRWRAPGGSCSRSSPRRCPGARSTPRCASRAPRTPRWCRCFWPACRWTSRSTRRCPASALARATAGGDRAASRRVRGPGRRAHRAGRNRRHALRQTIANERFDRIVIAAAAHGGPGFDPDDVAWLLANAPGEIVVLRPSADDQIVPFHHGRRAASRRASATRRCSARRPVSRLSEMAGSR